MAIKKTKEEILCEVAELRSSLNEAEETLRAIKQGEVDALVVSGPHGDQVYLLQGAEHPYRMLVESMNEGAVTLTGDGNIIYCNRAFIERAGVAYRQLLGVRFRDIVSEKDSERFDILWKNTLQGIGAGEIDLRLKNDGLPVYLSCRTLVHDEVLTVFAIVTFINRA